MNAHLPLRWGLNMAGPLQRGLLLSWHFRKPQAAPSPAKHRQALLRSQFFQERYDSFADPDIPPFHYGSHYSSAGIVLFYLLRMEPFTGLARSLQVPHQSVLCIVW